MKDDLQMSPYLPVPQEEAKHSRVHVIRHSIREGLWISAICTLVLTLICIVPPYLMLLMKVEVRSDPKAAIQLSRFHDGSLAGWWTAFVIFFILMSFFPYLKHLKHSVEIGEGKIRIQTDGVIVAERSLTGCRFLIWRGFLKKRKWLLLFESGEELSLPEMAPFKHRKIGHALKTEAPSFSVTNAVIHQFESPGKGWFFWLIAVTLGSFCIASLVVTWVSAQILLHARDSPQWVALAFPVLVSVLWGWGAFYFFQKGRKRITKLTDAGIVTQQESYFDWEDIVDFRYCRDGGNGRFCYIMLSKIPFMRNHSIRLAQAMTQDEVSALWKKLGERVPRFRSPSEPEA